MGYRSSWRLVINSADKPYTQKFRDWLDQQVVISPEPEPGWNEVAKAIKDSLIVDADVSLEYEDGYSKCSDPWDSFITAVQEFCCEGSGLDAAYARIGEDFDDTEVKEGNYTWVYIERGFGDPTYDKVPTPTSQAPVTAHTTKKCDCGGDATNSTHYNWCEKLKS